MPSAEESSQEEKQETAEPIQAPIVPAVPVPVPTVPVEPELIHCAEQGCGNQIDPNTADTDVDNGNQYCSEHISKCANCHEEHCVDSMHLVEGDYLCGDCFAESHVICPNCSETVLQDDYYPPNGNNRRTMREGGCKNCAKVCEDCSKVIDDDDTISGPNGDPYCEYCYSNRYSNCDECGETINSDDAICEESSGPYCEHCHDKKYTSCEECNDTIENSDAHEYNGNDYCEDCFQRKSPEFYQAYTEKFSEFSYTKKDKFLNELIKLLPISIKELKSKHQSLANGLNDLIVFSGGKNLTIEIVQAFRKSLSPEIFPVDYTTWDGSQRSIEKSPEAKEMFKDKPQLVINVLTSKQMLQKLNSNPALYDIFDTINNISKESTHPYIKDQIGWIRTEIAPNNEYMLVDEIQCDHANAVSKLKEARISSDIESIIQNLADNISQKSGNISREQCKNLMLLSNLDKKTIEGVLEKSKVLNKLYAKSIQYNYDDLKYQKAIDRIYKYKGLLLKKYNITNSTYNSIVDNHELFEKAENDLPEIKKASDWLKEKHKLSSEKLNKALTGYSDVQLIQVRNNLKSKYSMDDDQLDKMLSQYFDIIKDYNNIAAQAASNFAKQNGIKRLFWHTYEGGKALKNNAPPKSIYDQVPTENFYKPTENKPFDLEQKFFEKEAKRANGMYRMAKRLYLKYA